MLEPKKRFLRQDAKEKVRKLLSKEHNACYILITCKQASDEGKMQVEMTYEGDSGLAAYLIDNAQDFFNQEPNLAQE